MKTKILTFLLFLTLTNTFGQIKYEMGYIVDNENIKKECLIKNKGWNNNPTEFEYQLTEKDEPLTGTIEDFKEFGIEGKIKYLRANVEIDYSSDNVNNLSGQRNPDWVSKTVFLQAITEGSANLYLYKEKGLVRFFYSKRDSLPRQLVYKRYVDNSSSGAVKTNKTFQNQLWADVRIEDATVTSVASLNYKLADLEKYFIKYNESRGDQFLSYNNTLTGSRMRYNFKIKPSLDYSSLKIWNNLNATTLSNTLVDFGYHFNYKIGIEAELVLPFNGYKWAVLLEPQYKKFNGEGVSGTEKVVAKINTAEVALGLRYYLYLNDNSKLFINALMFENFNFNSKIDYDGSSQDLNIISKSMSFIGLGIGYVYHDKYSIEFRRDPDTNVFDYIYWKSDYYSYSLTFGYTFFNKK